MKLDDRLARHGLDREGLAFPVFVSAAGLVVTAAGLLLCVPEMAVAGPLSILIFGGGGLALAWWTRDRRVAARSRCAEHAGPCFSERDEHCPAHGRARCAACHRNPGSCEGGENRGCGYWACTGMHWDTCPNRIRRDTV